MKSSTIISLGILCFLAVTLPVVAPAHAFPASALLSDKNGDGEIQILTFGDSITVGVGDTPSTRGGYPARLASILGISVINRGVNGDALAQNGLSRLKSVVRKSTADTVIFNEGNSDAYIPSLSIGRYRTALVAAVGYVRRLNKNLVLSTQYPTNFQVTLSARRLLQVNDEIRDVAARNGLHVIDIDRAWRTTCNKLPNCNLLYKDGLHPNSKGYDVITDVALGVLAKINVFARGAAAQVEAAYDLPSGSVIVKPGNGL